MKPSERIADLEEDRFQRVKHVDPLWQHRQGEYREACQLRAIVDYLDEQHERQQRLDAFRNALAMIGPGTPEAPVNAELERAGIHVRVFHGMTYENTRTVIITGAREAGLL